MITALTFNGINYLSGGSAKQFVSMEASWENNFRPGFFPGSGTQDGYQIQGRFEWGDRAFAVQFVVRVQAGSTEYSNLINLTTGTATFTVTRDANNSFTMLIQKMGFSVAELGNTDGIVTLQITGVQLYRRHQRAGDDDDRHAANGHLPIGGLNGNRKESGLRCVEAVRGADPVGRREELRGAVPIG